MLIIVQNYHTILSLVNLVEKWARSGKRRAKITKIEIGAIPPPLKGLLSVALPGLPVLWQPTVESPYPAHARAAPGRCWSRACQLGQPHWDPSVQLFPFILGISLINQHESVILIRHLLDSNTLLLLANQSASKPYLTLIITTILSSTQ